MNFLCLDTTLDNCSVHIISSNRDTFSLNDANYPPSDIMPTLVGQALSGLGLKKSDITGIIIATGPGNYTSLRVGISFGSGLAKALSIPVYGISSLQALMLTHKKRYNENTKLLVGIKARGEDYFLQLFDNNCLSLIKPVKADIIRAKELFFKYNLLFLGSGSLNLATNFGQEENIITTEDKIDFLKVYKSINKNLLDYENNIWPLYLSEPIAEKKDPLWFAKKIK